MSKRSFNRRTLAIACGLAVCSGCRPVDHPRLVDAVMVTIAHSTHRELTKVTQHPFKMAPASALDCRGPVPQGLHADSFCDVYVNEPAKEPMYSGIGQYPEGSIVIKQKYTDRNGSNTELFTVMCKMHDGYDPANGNWEYATIDSDGSTVLSRGKLESCIACHIDYDATDYVSRIYVNSK